MFAVFAAHFTPGLFAMGGAGPERMRNIYRFAYYVDMSICEGYIVGWLNGKRFVRQRTYSNRGLMIYEIICGSIILVMLYMYGGSTLTPINAIASIRSGEARAYKNEWEESRVLLEDEDIQYVELSDFSTRPYLLYNGEYSAFNTYIAEFYGKKSVEFK